MWRRLAWLTGFGLVIVILAGAVVHVSSRHPSSHSKSRAIPVSLSCADPRFCIAVDDQGNTIGFNGATWTRPTFVSRYAFSSVSCPSASFCTAVDVGGNATMFNGHSWSRPQKVDTYGTFEASTFGFNGLTHVSCTGSTFCLAVDDRGYSFTFNGTTWGQQQPIAPDYVYTISTISGGTGAVGVSCYDPTFCEVALAFDGAANFNGLDWSVKPKSWLARHAVEPLSLLRRADKHGLSGLTALSCPSPVLCIALDSSGNVFTFNGTKWSAPVLVDPESVTNGAGSGLTAISCPSVSFCMAVDGAGNALTFNGTTWSAPRPVDHTLGLASVSCSGPTFCVALDDFGSALVYNGYSWSTPQAIDP